MLHIDDEWDDLTLVRIALEGARVPVSVQSFTNGAAGLKHLEELALSGAKTLPDLVILDLKSRGNLAEGEGPGTLARIRADKRLSHLPVFILTGSEDPLDRVLAESLGVREYIIKTPGYRELVHAVRTFFLAAPTSPAASIPGDHTHDQSSRLPPTLHR